jgi:phosphoribosylformylglycinamidine synthase
VELSGSEWAWVTHEHLGGVPPQVDLAHERLLADLLAEAARVGHLSSAHDLSDGGLAQSLVESCLRRGVGARIAVPERFAGGSMPFVYLFSESAGRVLVSVPRGHEKALTALCAERGVPFELIGVTDPAGGALEVHGQFRIGLDELRAAHTATLPRLFGGSSVVEVSAPATGVAVAVEAVPLPDAGRAETAPLDPADVVSEPIASAGPVPSTGAVEPVAQADAAAPPAAEAADGPAEAGGASDPDSGDTEQPSAPDKR